MTKSKILFYFCLSFILGILFNFTFSISQIYLLVFIILGISLISIFWKYKKIVLFGFCILFFIFGIYRYQMIFLNLEDNKLKNYFGKNVTLIGIVNGEPSIREKTAKLKIKIDTLSKASERDFSEIRGSILITNWKYPQYKYGDKLKITGKLKEVKNFDGFNYKDYLLKDGILALMHFPKIELIGCDFGNPLLRILFYFKNKLKESLNKFFSPPHSGLLEALIFGDEENISNEWKEKFNFTGTRHITAVSGMNITIISSLLLNFLLMLKFWRSQAFYLSVILISFYILLIGAPSSGIRAGIMGILFLVAQHFGRISTGSRAVVLVATLMLLINPLLLKFDIGFQLSFLAILGLIFLQEVFLDTFKKVPNNFQLKYNLASTLAAQTFTFPILIYNFGKIPLFSPLINIFILPLLPAITILGFISAFLGMISQFLGQIVSLPTWLISTYILKVIDFSSKIPLVSFTLQNVNWVFLLISYLILILLTLYLQERQKLKFLKY